MRLTTTASILLFAFGGTAVAQTLNVTDATRSIRGFAYGFDYEFNDGLEVTDSHPDLSGEWISQVNADLQDYYGVDVSSGVAYQESQIDPQALYFTLDVWAEVYGNLFQADSSGRGDYEVSFDVTEKVRYRVIAHADTDVGYNMASVRLSGAGGDVFQISGDYGGYVSLTKTGWLDAGSYTLDGEAEVQSYGGSGSPDLQTGNAECDFKIYHAADYDMDGDVDAADKSKFKADYLAGDPDADFDGDGDTDLQDWKKFRKAWNNA